MFADRHDAGKQLAEKLKSYKGADAVVLALPRGGVVVGREVARTLALPLDIVVTRKVGHPDNPEYAICAVDEKGMLLCDEAEMRAVSKGWLKSEVERQRKEAKRRAAAYRGDRAPEEVRGRTAIIVDDGIATGLSVRLAVRAVRTREPGKIVVAVPVASAEALRELREEGADTVVLEPPERFMGAIGAHYRRFEQVTDEEVIEALE
jgi:predicted phosphoribosyltransferase